MKTSALQHGSSRTLVEIESGPGRHDPGLYDGSVIRPQLSTGSAPRDHQTQQVNRPRSSSERVHHAPAHECFTGNRRPHEPNPQGGPTPPHQATTESPMWGSGVVGD